MTDFIATVGAAVTATMQSLSSAYIPLRTLIESHFGPNGLLAAYIVAAVLAFLLVYKLVQLAFAALKYVVIPSVILALLASLLLPYPFATVLPFTVAGCSLLLLFKG
ncbi:MAG: hypothetical protein IPH75_11130 [bacterium]|nr:hypothetical protein [bacterium]